MSLRIIGLACLVGALIGTHATSEALAKASAKARTSAVKATDGEGRHASPKRAWLGTALANLNDVDRKQKGVPRYGGVLVLRVLKNSPASRTGFLSGDVIMRLDEKYVYQPRDIIKRVASTPVGRNVKIDVIRNGGWLTATVKLTARPDKLPPEASEQKASDTSFSAAPPSAAPPSAASTSTVSKERIRVSDGITPKAQSGSSSAAVASRLQNLEKEVRSLREAVQKMKRQCSR